MPVIFILGIIGIALEDIIRVNKAATAVGMCVVLWSVLLIDAVSIYALHPPELLEDFIKAVPEYANLGKVEQAYKFLEFTILHSLGDVSTTLFFVLASMAIIDEVDKHDGFHAITHSIVTKNKRRLLWIFSFITFFLSAVLGDLAVVIVMIAIARRVIPERNERVLYSCMIIVAANAGGCWSPIGDVTTLLLWTGGNISVLHQVSHLFLSGLIMMLIPLILLTLSITKGEEINQDDKIKHHIEHTVVGHRMRLLVLTVGVASLVLVPVFQSLFNLPPFMGVLFGLAVLWALTDIRYYKSNSEELKQLRMGKVFSRVDVATIFFFLGILMSVQALKAAGHLAIFSDVLNDVLPSSGVIALVLGVCSSFLDNVALVSATMGMFPISDAGVYMADSDFWTFLTYCAVTGGSILIIGSASGVTVMGIEKIPFSYYLKRFTPILLLSYLAGASAYWLIF